MPIEGTKLISQKPFPKRLLRNWCLLTNPSLNRPFHRRQLLTINP